MAYTTTLLKWRTIKVPQVRILQPPLSTQRLFNSVGLEYYTFNVRGMGSSPIRVTMVLF